MTEKEKEAIERLNRFKTIKVLYGSTFAMTIEQLKVLQEDIETVLNTLKEKDKEIEKKDKIIDLITEDMLKGKCYFSNRTLIKNYYKRKVEEC